MKFPVKLVAFSTAATLLIISTLVSVQCAPSDGQQLAAGPIRAKISVPTLFDIELYKKLFHKSYSSLAEQMLRVKYFMARALRVFVSAVRYANRQLNYHLAVNHLSDRTGSELDRMRNRLLDKRPQGQKKTSTFKSLQREDSELNIPDLGERPYETLVELLETRKAEPFYAELLKELHVMQQADGRPGEAEEIVKELIRSSRSKREVNSIDETHVEKLSRKSPRKLTLDKLISLGSNERLSREAAEKVVRGEPKGNNSNYTGHELLLDRDTRGMRDQQVPVELKKMASKVKLPGRALKSPSYRTPTLDQTDHFLDGLKRKHDTQSAGSKSTTILPDEVFFDLRDSNCFFLPRDQQQCGSCYAFAAISLMEYLYCKKTKQLVGFSEQYVVDCGREHYGESVQGCSGGYIQEMAGFFHNFGLETRSIYPYQNQDDVCPYLEGHELDGAGFIRMDIKKAWEVPLDRFEEILKLSPILINIVTPDDFHEYGAGVHPNECDNTDDSQERHSMLLIGYGREDNEEYWLIRNSYSVGWGEGGHFKMSRKSRCLDNDQGWIFGSSDGENLDLVVKPNHKYDEDLIMEHYLASL